MFLISLGPKVGKTKSDPYTIVVSYWISDFTVRLGWRLLSKGVGQLSKRCGTSTDIDTRTCAGSKNVCRFPNFNINVINVSQSVQTSCALKLLILL